MKKTDEKVSGRNENLADVDQANVIWHIESI